MKNIEQILADLGIELDEEQKKTLNKAVTENYKTIAEHEKTTGKLTTELESLKTTYEDAKKSLAGFDGVDVDALKKQIEEANAKVIKAEEDAKNALAARDYRDMLKTQVDGLSFSSNSARERFMQKLTEKNLPIENGKLLGFDDYVTAYKESDEGAIIEKEAAENKAKFTDGMKGGSTTIQGKESELLAKIMAAAGVSEKE